MKNTTLKKIQQTDHFMSRAIIDRKTKKENAIIEEQRAITKECKGNVLPAYLYNYYVSICNIPTWNLSNDSMVAKQLGITERKVADTRRLLTKLEWIRFDISKHNHVTYAVWYLGRDVVRAKIDMTTPLEDFLELGIILEEEYELAKTLEETIENIN